MHIDESGRNDLTRRVDAFDVGWNFVRAWIERRYFTVDDEEIGNSIKLLRRINDASVFN